MANLSIPISWIPYTDVALLTALVILLCLFLSRRRKDFRHINEQEETVKTALDAAATDVKSHLDAQNALAAKRDEDILNLLKVLVGELRQRPCVIATVEYKTDASPKEAMREARRTK